MNRVLSTAAGLFVIFEFFHPVRLAAENSNAKAFAAQALALRAAGVAGEDTALSILTKMADGAPEEYLLGLWQPFFENAVVKLGRLQSPAPVALYHNPLLDITLLTFWKKDGLSYNVATIRALPGEKFTHPNAEAGKGLPWLDAEDGPFLALRRLTADRLAAFRRLHPADAQEGGHDNKNSPTTTTDMRVIWSRLAWLMALRVHWAEMSPWLLPTMIHVDSVLKAADADVLITAAPGTDRENAAALAGLPANYTARLTLDMTLEIGEEDRLLIASLPDDGDIYVFISCRLGGNECTPERFMLLSLLD